MLRYSGNLCWYRECWIIFQFIFSLICNVFFPQIILENFGKQREMRNSRYITKPFFGEKDCFSVLVFLRLLELWFLSFIAFQFASASFVLIIDALYFLQSIQGKNNYLYILCYCFGVFFINFSSSTPFLERKALPSKYCQSVNCITDHFLKSKLWTLLETVWHLI